jgi:hypothetical protein
MGAVVSTCMQSIPGSNPISHLWGGGEGGKWGAVMSTSMHRSIRRSNPIAHRMGTLACVARVCRACIASDT